MSDARVGLDGNQAFQEWFINDCALNKVGLADLVSGLGLHAPLSC